MLATGTLTRLARNYSLLHVLAALLLALGSSAPPAFAQAVYGSVAGTILDTSGAALPGVTVTITSVDRKTVDTVVTNEAGRYIKDRLLPGRYEVAAEISGFKRAVFPDIQVSVDTQTTLDVKLEVGQISEAVTVQGFSPILKTDRADVATSFDTKQITELPVLDRNFTKFLLLTPGTQQLQWNHAASENPQGSTQTMVNGQHFSGTTYQLDGTENREPDSWNHRHQSKPRSDWRNEDHVAELRRRVRSGHGGRRLGADQVGKRTSSAAAGSSSIRATGCRRGTRTQATPNPLTGKEFPIRRKTSSADRWADRSCPTRRSSSATIKGCGAASADRSC